MGEQLSIKAERVKGFFLKSAKDIILNKGVSGISIREIAERAGYSYATLYNYFENLDDLLLQTKTMMFKNIRIYMDDIQKGNETGLEEIKKDNKAYVEYYFERPHIYSFLFSHRLEKQLLPEELNLEDRWQKAYKTLVEDGTMRVEDVPVAAKTIIYAMQGLLALYFSNSGLSKDEFLEELDDLEDYIILGEKRK